MMKVLHKLLVLLCAIYSLSTAKLGAQAQPLPGSDTSVIYQRLLAEVEKIPIFDHHAHPGFPDDPDVDAMAAPPDYSEPLRVRSDNPELAAASKALFGYPYSDFSPEHAGWLIAKKTELKQQYGDSYFSHILDQVGIQTSIANRVAMPPYLDPSRFRWVFFVDNLLLPFDNRRIAARNPDEGVYIPLQEKILRRNLQQSGLQKIPAGLPVYLAFISQLLEHNRKNGAIAMKFEVAYLRPVKFGDPPSEQAAAIYAKYQAGGIPTETEYLVFQDYVFRYLLAEAGRLRLPVHIHTAIGIGDYFNLQEGNVMNLENVLRDPRYSNVTFVLLHGGYPYERQAIWFAARKNVYLDSSLMELVLFPSQFKEALKQWLELFPDKIMFGSDSFPYNDVLGSEESYWLAVRSARTALAAALAEMVAANEVTESKALALAHAYLHDTAMQMYSEASRKSQPPGR
jgi:uncharacterized protein